MGRTTLKGFCIRLRRVRRADVGTSGIRGVYPSAKQICVNVGAGIDGIRSTMLTRFGWPDQEVGEVRANLEEESQKLAILVGPTYINAQVALVFCC